MLNISGHFKVYRIKTFNFIVQENTLVIKPSPCRHVTEPSSWTWTSIDSTSVTGCPSPSSTDRNCWRTPSFFTAVTTWPWCPWRTVSSTAPPPTGASDISAATWRQPKCGYRVPDKPPMRYKYFHYRTLLIYLLHVCYIEESKWKNKYFPNRTLWIDMYMYIWFRTMLLCSFQLCSVKKYSFILFGSKFRNFCLVFHWKFILISFCSWMSPWEIQ